MKIFEFYEDNTHIYIITELCEGVELFNYIIDSQTNFSEQIIAGIIK